MIEGSGTRSSMLWEVGRILNDCYRGGYLPQILLMENVPQVHNKKNMECFNLWLSKLEELGYKNYWEDLNAKDFGVPQNRKRTFVVSILDDYKYEFPKSIELKTNLIDLLEDEVDEKYYLSDKQLNYVLDMNNVALSSGRDINQRIINPTIAKTISCRGAADQRADVTNFVVNKNDKEYKVIDLKRELDFITPLQKEVCNKALNFVKPTDIIDYTYSNSRLEEMRNDYIKTKNKENNDIMCTLTTKTQNFGVCVEDNNVYTETEKQLFTKEGDIKRYINSDIVDKFTEGQMATTSFPNGYGHGSRTHDVSITLNTLDKPNVKYKNRIRKLIPKECFRVMGVKDEDFEKIAKNQSDSSLYHLAGDSIVTTCLGAIFGSLFGIDWTEKFSKLGIIKK